jgi:MFS family permease
VGIDLVATYLVLASGIAVFALVQGLTVPILPALETTLHTSQSDATWILTAYLLSAAVCAPLLGRLGEVVGNRQALIVTLAAGAIGSMLGALAPNLMTMVVGRCIQGVGVGVLPIGFAVVRQTFPARMLAGTVGSLATIQGLGSGCGIVMAGPIAATFGVRWVFWFPAIVGALAIIGASVVVSGARSATRPGLSLGSAALLSLSLLCGLLGVNKGATWGWTSSPTLGVLVLATVAGVAWVLVELRVKTPLVNMRVMGLRPVWTCNLVALFAGFTMFGSFSYIPQFIQVPTNVDYGLGASASLAGLLLLPYSGCVFLSGQYSGHLVRVVGARLAIFAGATTTTLGLVLLVLAHHHLWQVSVSGAVIGVGNGMLYAALSSLVVVSVPLEHTGVASGMTANIRTIGGCIGVAVTGGIITLGVPDGGIPSVHAYQAAFVTLAIVAGTAAAVSALLPPGPRPPRRAPQASTLP